MSALARLTKVAENRRRQRVGGSLCLGQQTESAVQSGNVLRGAGAPDGHFPGAETGNALHLSDDVGPMKTPPVSLHASILSKREPCGSED